MALYDCLSSGLTLSLLLAEGQWIVFLVFPVLVLLCPHFKMTVFSQAQFGPDILSGWIKINLTSDSFA